MCSSPLAGHMLIIDKFVFGNTSGVVDSIVVCAEWFTCVILRGRDAIADSSSAASRHMLFIV